MARAALTPRRAGALALAALVLGLVLIQPDHPGAMTWGALRLVPLELPAILLGLAALGDRAPGRASFAGSWPSCWSRSSR